MNKMEKVSESDFLKFASEVLGVPVGSIGMDTAYQSIPEWDSIKHMHLVMEVSAEYGVEISLEKVVELKTLGDFYRFCIS